MIFFFINLNKLYPKVVKNLYPLLLQEALFSCLLPIVGLLSKSSNIIAEAKSSANPFLRHRLIHFLFSTPSISRDTLT